MVGEASIWEERSSSCGNKVAATSCRRAFGLGYVVLGLGRQADERVWATAMKA